MATEVGGIFVALRAKLGPFKKDLAGAAAMFKATGARMQSVGRSLSLGLTLPLAAIGGATFKMAADAAENAQKFEVVFGDMAEGMLKWIDELKKSVPATTAELQAMTSEMQDLLQPFGIAPELARDLSKAMVALAGDLASFNNTKMTDVLRDIRSGLIGQAEPLFKYGVDVRVAAVKTKALEMGLIAEGEALTDVSRSQAAFALILERTTKAHGDAARTVESSANQLKFFGRNLREVGETIGNVLLPVFTPWISAGAKLFKQMQEMNPELLKQGLLALGLAATLGPVILLLGLLTSAIGVAISPIGLFITSLVGFGAAMVALKNNFGAASDFLNKKIEESFETLLPFTKWIEDTFSPVFAGVGESFKGLFGIVFDTVVRIETITKKHFGATLEFVTEWVKEIIQNFKDLGNALIFRSIVPEIVEGIGKEFDKLKTKMVKPTAEATTDVLELYKQFFTDLDIELVGGVNTMSEKWVAFLDKFTGETRSAFQKFGQITADTMDDFGRDLAKGRASFKDFGRALKDGLIDLAFDIAFPQSKGGVLGGIGKFIGSIFGGGRAAGGRVQPGKSFLVGESGPEPFVPDTAGKIFPNSVFSKTRDMQPIVVESHYHIGLGVAETVRAEFLNLAPLMAEISARKVAEIRGGGGSAAHALGA